MSAIMIDAHAHLSDARLVASWDVLIPSLKERGLSHLVLGGVEPEEWQRQFQLSRLMPGFVTPVVGIHPWTVRDKPVDELEAMFQTLEAMVDKASAVGELGVDFSRDSNPVQRMKQPEWADRQLDLAMRHQKPVVLHVVKGHDVMHGLLRHYRGKPGIVHGWRGSEQDGRKYVDRAFVLSIGLRSITRLKPLDLSWLPPENFVLESDGPDFVVAGGKLPDAKNWMLALKEVATFMGKALKLTPEQVWALNKDNLERILGFQI